MDVMGGEIEKERFFLVLPDEGRRLVGDGVGDRIVLPDGGGAAGHETDPADAADDRAAADLLFRIAVVRPHQLRMGFGGGGIDRVFAIADLDRIGRIVVDHLVVFDIDAGDPVAGGGDDERIVETDGIGSGIDLLVVVRWLGLAQAQMPFADAGGGIAGLFGDRGDGRLVLGNAKRINARENRGACLAPGIAAGEQRIAGGGAGGGGGIAVGKPHSLHRQPVDIRGLDLGCAVAAEVAIADVVAKDDDDVGWPHRLGCLLRPGGEGGKRHGGGQAGNEASGILHSGDPCA